VMGMAVEPVAGVDQEALALALARLAREDPTFRRQVDRETGELVLSGMGELHLEVLAYRLEHEHGVRARLGRPRVALRQRITRAVTARGRYVRQNGGPGAFADVTLALRPLSADEAAGGAELVFEPDVRGGAVDRSYWSAVEAGVRAEFERGGPAGVRIVGVHATLVDGAMHAQDSNERAFEAAGALAVREALGGLGVELLEPWMTVVVEGPTEHAGAVIGDLRARRGQVGEVIALSEGSVRVRATAPMAELFGYPVHLRSLTQGRGGCVLEPDGFRPAPARRLAAR
jgi:elongation factor G